MTPDIRTAPPATDGPLADALLGMGRFLRKGEVSGDLRTLFLEGGRQGDAPDRHTSHVIPRFHPAES